MVHYKILHILNCFIVISYTIIYNIRIVYTMKKKKEKRRSYFTKKKKEKKKKRLNRQIFISFGPKDIPNVVTSLKTSCQVYGIPL